MCQHSDYSTIVSLSAYDDILAVGDMLRSVYTLSIVEYDELCLKNSLRDLQPRWTTAGIALSNDAVMGADMMGNLWVSEKPLDSPFLQACGQFNLGDQINKMASGSSIANKKDLFPAARTSQTSTSGFP
jgi:hypothetical protein